jgi:hypothetical protein
MRIGAKIMLSMELDTARDGLDRLAGGGWLMTVPQPHDVYHGHPAGRALPGRAAAGGEPVLVAVTFGTPPATPASAGGLPVQWESVDPGGAFAVLLVDGDITPAAAPAPGHSTLALSGCCRLLSASAANGDDEQAWLEVLKETARLFITSVGVVVTRFADPGEQPQPPGPAWSWLTGQRSGA